MRHDPGRQRVRVFRVGGQEGSNSGCAETLGDRGFELSARADRRVRVLCALRPWTSEGSSFPCWAPGGFEFSVRCDPGCQRVRIFHMVAQKISSDFNYRFPCLVQVLERHLKRVSGTAEFGCPQGSEGLSFGCTATLDVKGFKFSVLGNRRVRIVGAPRPWASEGSNFRAGGQEGPFQF